MQARCSILLSLVLLAITLACQRPVTEAPSTQPSELCRAYVDAFAKRAEECGLVYEESYQVVVSAAAAGSCDNIQAIRDAEEFEKVCIPFHQNLSCEKLHAGTDLPPACRDQMHHEPSPRH